ncbi:hypothetical protein [Pseudoalteromonas denitrificans]|uniref:Uncharacterized protein n=1 Tax=Pseudoalteromonas denitrificans DSM 6059 TaxID=1123010 RepID=A0A1I1QW35_9GAMM|nr:hypothetical protein [Pseudoalteromonas denitrificans]SFD26289.1 hypothetical protein SAMN02745724_04038 [Pseudoalteromonas denitrificans DSM 6059]
MINTHKKIVRTVAFITLAGIVAPTVADVLDFDRTAGFHQQKTSSPHAILKVAFDKQVFNVGEEVKIHWKFYERNDSNSSRKSTVTNVSCDVRSQWGIQFNEKGLSAEGVITSIPYTSIDGSVSCWFDFEYEGRMLRSVINAEVRTITSD